MNKIMVSAGIACMCLSIMEGDADTAQRTADYHQSVYTGVTPDEWNVLADACRWANRRYGSDLYPGRFIYTGR